jgi:hypothetical protein
MRLTRNATCTTCQKFGHYGAQCRTKPQNSKGRHKKKPRGEVRHVKEELLQDEDLLDTAFVVTDITSGKKNNILQLRTLKSMSSLILVQV